MKQNLFTKKNQLDEMQERTLTKIEARGFWLMWWSLAAVLAIQTMMNAGGSQMLWEWAVFMLASVYTLVECLRHGIWDRHFKANTGVSVVGSLVGGLAVVVIVAVSSGFLLLGIVFGAITAVLIFAVLQLCSSIYKKRRSELENAPEDKDDK